MEKRKTKRNVSIQMFHLVIRTNARTPRRWYLDVAARGDHLNRGVLVVLEERDEEGPGHHLAGLYFGVLPTLPAHKPQSLSQEDLAHSQLFSSKIGARV